MCLSDRTVLDIENNPCTLQKVTGAYLSEEIWAKLSLYYKGFSSLENSIGLMETLMSDRATQRVTEMERKRCSLSNTKYSTDII